MPIEFVTSSPSIAAPNNMICKSEEIHMKNEIKTLLQKGVIVKCPPEKGEILSPVFLRPKSDGTYRLILNLKKANEYIQNFHFKMDTIHTVLNLVKPNCFMASIDIKDAYYSIKIDEQHQKYLKFKFQGQCYNFTCLPNGLCCGPRKFTKLMKAPLAELRKRGHLVSSFIDDLINFGDTYEECIQNVADTILILQRLGLTTHPEKSHLIPTQEITFLGFIINSKTMKIKLTEEKMTSIFEECQNALHSTSLKIRDVAKVIGKIIATFPAVKYGPLHFRFLESCKSKAVKMNKGNYNAPIYLDKPSQENLAWWVNDIRSTYNDIYMDTPTATLYTDASNLGWGAVYKNRTTKGSWNEKEQSMHINALELKAILFGIKSLVQDEQIHLQILCDNTSAVHILNKMGSSHTEVCDALVREIWFFATSKNIWLSASHIPGKQNVDADRESREHDLQIEWKLSASIFHEIIAYFGRQPDIDMFASRINYQLTPFVSYRPDPDAFAVDAFQLNWKNYFFYAFPPFCLIGRILQKVLIEEAEGIVIVPNWPNQPWYSRLTRMLKTKPFCISRRKQMLHLPSKPGVQHPLHNSLELLACHLGGKS